MSNKILNRVWKDKTVKSSRDRLALLSLADQANDDGICWPGLRSIEKRMNCSKPTAAKAINRLEHLGAIAVFESHGKFGRRSNHYIVKVGMDEQEYDAALAAMDDKIGISEARKPENYETPELPELIKNKESQGKPILTDPVNPSLPCQGKPILTDPVNPSLPDPIVNPHYFNHNGSHSVPNGTMSPPPPENSKPPKSKPKSDDTAVTEMLAAWGRFFPDKSQPRPATYRSKIKTRMKSPDFQEHWLVAMERAANSSTCQNESWFQFEFFVRNDENWRKCHRQWMAWKDKDIRASKNGNDANDVWQSIKIALGKPGKPDISDRALQAVGMVPGGWRRFKEQDVRFIDQLKPLFEEAYERTKQQQPTAA